MATAFVHNPVRLVMPHGHGRRVGANGKPDEIPCWNFKFSGITQSCLVIDGQIFPDFEPHHQPFVEPAKPKKVKSGRGRKEPAGSSDRSEDGGASKMDEEAPQEELAPGEKDPVKEKFDEVAENGTVSPHSAQTLARQMGLSPSFADQEAFTAQNPPPWDYAMFKKYVRSIGHPEDNQEDFATTLTNFADGAENLSSKQLMNILETFGEPLSPEESAAFIANVGGGPNYEPADVAGKLLQKTG